MENKKETWEKPELIIINQCYIEENVLAACAEAGVSSCGPSNPWTPNQS